MKRRTLAFLLLGALLAGARPAEAEITFKLPPPALRGLLPLAALPLDKPPVALPPVATPPPPQGLPELPQPRLVSDIIHRPVAPLPLPRMLACNPVGTVFRVASELVECGRARYQRGELEPAREALQSAVQGSTDRDVLREARYWLGETLLRLGRTTEVERVLLLVGQDDPYGEFAPFATHTLGWVALELNDPARALGYFDKLAKGRVPVTIIAHLRHGRALALYGLKRYAEAREQWSTLLGGREGVPGLLAAEANFWLGDTLGRLGDYKGAVARLSVFTASRPPLLVQDGLLSLGWWSRAAGQPRDAVRAYRSALSSYPQAPALALWARAGLVQALLDLDDYPAAREEVGRLEALDKAGTLALPTLLIMRRWAADTSRIEEGRALDTELLARNLDPAARAWVLLLSGDLARLSGSPGEARDPFEMVRAAPAAAPVKQAAEFRLAQLHFDAREFAQAQAAAQRLLGDALGDDVRAAALVLAAESAYWARDYEAAAALYSRFLTDLPARPEAPSAGLALGWAELRRGRLDAARERWTIFAREAPSDPRAPEALLLAAELAAKGGGPTQARLLLDRVVGQYPGTEHADVATLNRAILALNAGRPAEALTELGRLGGRTSASPSLARARVAKGLALIESGRPAEAEAELKGALGQGDDAICHLAIGVIAFRQEQWAVATREFTETRDTSGGAMAAAAEYGLAAAAFDQGKAAEFKPIASRLLTGPSDPARTPHLLHGMLALAAEEKRWADARTLTLRLVEQFPRHEAAPVALAAVSAAAGESAEWGLSREMYQLLIARYPSSPGRRAGRVAFAEALLRTSAAAAARQELEAFAAEAPPGDPRRARALPLLAEAQEATGDRAAAALTYARLATEYPTSKDAPPADVAAGRLLLAEGKWTQARPLLERAMKGGDSGVTAEAAYRMGEGLSATGEHDQAVEAYMTAAYVAPGSVWARRALLGAGRSFTALKQSDAAAIVYRKLLAASSVEPDLAAAARSGLKALGLN